MGIQARDLKIGTQTMNMIELSAVLNDTDTFEFFVKDLNMKHSRDLNPEKDNLMT